MQSSNEERSYKSQERVSAVNRRWAWTGFANKTLWDWMQFGASVSIPIALGLLSYLQWTADVARRDQDREIALSNQYNVMVADYLDDMTNLILDKQLLTSPENTSAKQIARARTLNILRQLDGGNKGQLLKFLYESALISSQCQTLPNQTMAGCQGRAILSLHDARLDKTTFERPVPLPGVDLTEASLSLAVLPKIDLTEANLERAILNDADLTEALLSKAKMKSARLSGTTLVDANLLEATLNDALMRGARMRGANLKEAKLVNADLKGADLSNATLTSAVLQGAKLQGVNLTEANLQGADLRGANLTGAILQGADLKGAIFNTSTTFPEGFNSQGEGMYQE